MNRDEREYYIGFAVAFVVTIAIIIGIGFYTYKAIASVSADTAEQLELPPCTDVNWYQVQRNALADTGVPPINLALQNLIYICATLNIPKVDAVIIPWVMPEEMAESISKMRLMLTRDDGFGIDRYYDVAVDDRQILVQGLTPGQWHVAIFAQPKE